MSAEVISLAQARQSRDEPSEEEVEPHTSGVARCAACAYEWVAVAPVGTLGLECPACGTMRGLFKFPFHPAERKQVYHCNTCESTHLIAYRTAEETGTKFMCAGCGSDHSIESVHPL